jgi:hypothetical protein
VKICLKPQEIVELQQLIKKIHFCREEELPFLEHQKTLKNKISTMIIKEKERTWLEQNM